MENLLIRRASSEGEEESKKSIDVVRAAENKEKVKIVSENEKIASENNQKLKIVSENEKSVPENKTKKRKKEEQTSSTTSPKKKKAKIEVPVVDSNDAEAVNRLTQRCVEFVNLSRRDNLTEETQQDLKRFV